MFSAFCAILFLGMTANAQSITVVPGTTAAVMAQTLVGSNVTVTNATYTGAAIASGSFDQATSTFPLSDGIILTSGAAASAVGPNNSTGMTGSNMTAGDPILTALAGFQTYDAAILEFDITSNCNTLTFDYIFASEEYLEFGCSSFNDAFGFFISGPGYAPNTNIALVPGSTTPVSINNVINAPGNTPPCVSNPSYYVDNAAGVSIQYDGRTVVLSATATIQPCQTYHIKIAVADAGDGALDSAIFLKGGGINCASPSLATTANIAGVECGALGSIDLSVNSGTGPFVYSWTGPNGFTATTEDIASLDAGVYTVDIVGSDCLSSGQATFTVPDNADATAPVFANCPSDISVPATNTNCSEAVTYTAPIATDNCPNLTVTSTHNPGDVFPVGTTAVTYTATDAAGNSSTCTFNVTVNAQPLSLSLNPYVWNGGWNIRCYGQNSGRVTGAAMGGCLPYTYSWSAGFQPPFGPPNTSTSLGLFAGPVTCTVTDANGNSVTETVVLTQPAPFVSTTTWTPIPCYGGTSTVSTSAMGGTMPYNGINNTIVPAGTYEYVMADANGCRAFDTVMISQPDILDITATPAPILCYGDTTTVTVAATGGTLPYTGTGLFQEVAGIYMYNVTDANGCSENITLAINQPAQLTAMISATPILCNGGTSQVTVTVASGTEPYTGTGIFTEYAGTHTYTVLDYNLCEDTISITITEPDPLVATATAGPYSCVTGVATVSVAASGGTAPYSGTGNFDEALGTYTYTVTDANGCTTTASATVSEIPASVTILGAPADATVECDAVPNPPAVIAVGTNGENINVSFTENILGSGCSYQIVRTWVAIDSCGNTEVATQTLDVQDTQAPVINCPADYTISCNNPFIPIDSLVITTTDCSNNVTVTISDSIVTGTAFVSSTTIYRTITASDDCGNVSSCTQVISGTPVLTEGECKKCDTEISIVIDPFNPSCVFVSSLCKDLSNVVLRDINGWEYKFDGLNGLTGYFCHPSGLPITDVWVKAGCYKSGDGPGYGHHFDPCSNGGIGGMITSIGQAGRESNFKSEATVSQYPNPASTSATFEYTVPNTDMVSLSIVGINGQMIETISSRKATANQLYTVTYDVSELESGIYFLYLTSSEGVTKKKFVVMK